MSDTERNQFDEWRQRFIAEHGHMPTEADAWQARAALAQQAVQSMLAAAPAAPQVSQGAAPAYQLPDGFVPVVLDEARLLAERLREDDWRMRAAIVDALCDEVQAARAAQAAAVDKAEAAPQAELKGMAAAVERVMDHRAHWRTAIVMMRDFGHMLAGKDGDADHTDWELVRKDFESALDALAAAPQAEQQAEKTTCPFCESEWVTPAQHDKNLATHRAALAAQQPEREPLSQAAQDVLAERQRQISSEGWTPQHDDEHTDGAMALAAGSYCESAAKPALLRRAPGAAFAMPKLWPMSWDLSWWRPKNPRADLVRAGALILAEIERLDRAHGIGKEGA